MLLIGHRGCHYPGFNQNTLRAFEKVVSEGIPAIEFDVQLTADGQLVVVHNLELDEVSTGTGKVVATDSRALKSLYAGDPAQGLDRIPFLREVFDYFASLNPANRPRIHLELKGEHTGKRVGELLKKYLVAGKLRYSDILASSFNWLELESIRTICPPLDIALLDGAIRRSLLLAKTGPEPAHCFPSIFAYGNEEYMLPRFPILDDNLALLDKACPDQQVRSILAEEITVCLAGGYYTDELLDKALEMNASSVNLWFRSVTARFIARAHQRGIAVLVYTANDPEDLQDLFRMNVDGIFTDNYREAVAVLVTMN